MIHVSSVAINEIKRLQSKQQTNTAVHLAVKSGGCSGLFYDLSFSPIDFSPIDSEIGNHLESSVEQKSQEHVNTEVEIFIANGLKIITDTHSFNHIQNLTIDYSEDLMGGGFRFTNPQATTTCGCGNSFSVS
jgi:iron-sulfur cluster assembly protein